MASGNRVDELESTVKELQATVNGLTDELVEAKVRIRELEDLVDDAGELDAVEGMAGTKRVSQSEPEPSGEAETGQEASEAAEQADTSKSEATESEDNTESESSDIIIA